MRSKSILVVLLCAAMLLTLFSACGSNTASDTASTTGAAANGTNAAAQTTAATEAAKAVTLTFSLWDVNQKPAMQAMADGFTKANSNVKINVECSNWNDYWTKLDAAAQAGTLPDVFWMHIAQLSKYVKGNMLQPLDDMLKADGFDLSQFPEALVKGGSLEGKQYGIPKDFDTIGLWYNKTLFDAKSVPYPTDSWTWDDMIAAGQKLTGDGVYGVGGGYDSQQTTYNTIPAAGGYVLSPDGMKSGYDLPASQEGMQCWIDLITEYKISPTQQQLTDTDSAAMFESGKLAMVFLGSWRVSELKSNEYTKGKVDVVQFPSFKGQKTPVINGLTYAMAATCKEKDTAGKFLEYLGSKDAQTTSAQMGAAIPALNGTQDAWVQASPDLHLQCFIDMAKISVPYPANPSMPVWAPSEQQLFPKAWSGQITLQDACKQMADIMNKAIAEN